MNEELNNISMQIILHAGDARLEITNALKLMEDNQFEEAQEKLKAAKAKIVLAHKSQTETIQKEASGEHQDFSLLFAHAQDTLMTINSEYNIASRLLPILEKIENRLEKLEND